MLAENEQESPFDAVTVDLHGRVVASIAGRAKGFSVDLGAGIALEMLRLPGGEFTMGSPPGEGYPDERPQHRVTIAPFHLARFPVTQEQWLAIMGAPAPCRFTGPRLPVENVSWFQAGEFCRRLATRSGRQYWLPAEAQWEYACRGGTITPFSCGETLTADLANYVGEHVYRGEQPGAYRHRTTDVGSFPPNPFGLHDMHGNVWEWCMDCWHENYVAAPADDAPWTDGGEQAYRVARGGSWHDGPNLCRSAARLRVAAGEGDDFFGFRVAAG